MAWTARLVTGSETDFVRTVENFEDGLEWLKTEHPASAEHLLKESTFKLNYPDYKQWGTGYHWFSMTRWG